MDVPKRAFAPFKHWQRTKLDESQFQRNLISSSSNGRIDVSWHFVGSFAKKVPEHHARWLRQILTRTAMVNWVLSAENEMQERKEVNYSSKCLKSEKIVSVFGDKSLAWLFSSEKLLSAQIWNIVILIKSGRRLIPFCKFLTDQLLLNFSLRNTGDVINKRKFSGMIIYSQHSELNFSKGDYGKPGTKGEGGDKGKPVFSITLTCCQV